jgi:hypothetical protein
VGARAVRVFGDSFEAAVDAADARLREVKLTGKARVLGC